jgi:hypothetical protein
MSFKASHLGGLVIGPEVEMQPTFDFLALCVDDHPARRVQAHEGVAKGAGSAWRKAGRHGTEDRCQS